MRSMLLALLVLALAPAAAAPAATATRPCPQADPANGLSGLRAGGISCKAAFAVARRTNSVKCFLAGNRCEHTHRGRFWTCVLDESSSRVTCRARGSVVKYRLG